MYAAKQNQPIVRASIIVNDTTVEQNISGYVQSNTVWLPLSDVVQALRQLGPTITYANHQLLIGNLAHQSGTLGTAKPGTLDIACGSTVFTNVPVQETTRSNSTSTAYIPVWYVLQALT